VEILKEIEGRFDDRVGANKNNIILELMAYIVHRLKHFRGFCLLCGGRIDSLSSHTHENQTQHLDPTAEQQQQQQQQQPAAATANPVPNSRFRGKPGMVATITSNKTNKLVICTKGKA